jgi:hypothetical protein
MSTSGEMIQKPGKLEIMPSSFLQERQLSFASSKSMSSKLAVSSPTDQLLSPCSKALRRRQQQYRILAKAELQGNLDGANNSNT